MNTVRFVVKLQNSQMEVSYVMFDIALLGAPVPQTGDVICFGEYHLVVRDRRYQMATQVEPHTITLHAGITRRSPKDTVNRESLVRELEDFPLVSRISIK